MRNRLITALSLVALMAALGADIGPVRAEQAAPAADPTTATPPGPAPAADAPTPPAPPAPGVTVTGNFEVYYTYNFNRPDNGSNTFIFNNRDAQFGLNLADVRVSKAATPASRAGFFIRLIEGDVRDLAIAPGDPENILEAYGTILVPVGGRDLNVDAGQFVTHIGYETIELGTNPNFSKSFLFQIPSPFYNAGVRAALPVGPRTTVTGYILNRFNGTRDPGNKDLAPGFQILHAVSPTSSLILNALGSRETVGADDFGGNITRQQNILDLIYTNQITPATKLGLEGLYRFGDNLDDESYSAFGVAGYGSFTLGNGNILSARAEFYKQDEEATGFLSAYNGGSTEDVELSSFTLTYELRSGLFPGLRTLFEGRYDMAGEDHFGGRDGDFKKSQFTLTLGQAYTF